MATSHTTVPGNVIGAQFLDNNAQRWFAACTFHHHEKYVNRQLIERSITSFLPLYRHSTKWTDRRKIVELPLFPGYIFVHIAKRDRVGVLELAAVVRFVTLQGRPVPMEDHEIECLRSGLEGGVIAEPHPLLCVGSRVRVVRGSMAGLEGILVRKKNKTRVVVSLRAIMQSIALEIDTLELEPC